MRSVERWRHCLDAPSSLLCAPSVHLQHSVTYSLKWPDMQQCPELSLVRIDNKLMPLGTTFDYCQYYLTYFAAQYSSKKDERMIGDYPDLPPISAQEKSPFGWWDPQDKRNREETVCSSPHIQAESYKLACYFSKKLLSMSLLRPFTLEPNCACVLIYAPKFQTIDCQSKSLTYLQVCLSLDEL